MFFFHKDDVSKWEDSYDSKMLFPDKVRWEIGGSIVTDRNHLLPSVTWLYFLLRTKQEDRLYVICV